MSGKALLGAATIHSGNPWAAEVEEFFSSVISRLFEEHT